MLTEKKIIGSLGEEAASRHLEKSGYKILERNFRTTFAEVDIICIKDDIIVFVEVKTRKDFEFEPAQTAVDYKKRTNLIKISRHYIMENRLYDFNVRFDIIECYWKLKRINHLIDVF